MLRAYAVLLLALAPACVGTNPRWDEDEVVGGESDSEAGETLGFEGSGDSGDSTTSADDTTSSDVGAVDDDAPAGCEDHGAVCGGECRDVRSDKHACGRECIDCTELYGADARCKKGECERKGDDDEDDD